MEEGWNEKEIDEICAKKCITEICGDICELEEEELEEEELEEDME